MNQDLNNRLSAEPHSLFRHALTRSGSTMLRGSILFAIALLILVSGCARFPRTGVTSLKPATTSELRGYLLNHKADLEQFRLRGPFAVDTQNDRQLRLSATEHFDADLYLSAPAEKAPLVIFLHGHDRSKDDHAYQAMHVASWGMHSLTLQLPNNGPWVANGSSLARIVELIYRRPEVIDSRIDVNKIILVGYSFGGSAVAVALAESAHAAGGILLDPAGTGEDLPKFLSQINKPVMLLGADEQISSTRDRGDFYHFIRSGIAEVSIRGASHEDAQYPADFPLQLFAGEPSATEVLQITFVSALTSAAFSLASTGRFDYAWTSFGDAINSGRIINAKKK
jgi:pimeloyl-ACP methyl ester carboxylesterase